jgi:hypothetical protein
VIVTGTLSKLTCNSPLRATLTPYHNKESLIFNEMKENNNLPQNPALRKTAVIRSFSYEEVYQIALDVMNLGMSLRQDQLRGWTGKSGNEALAEYMDRFTQS